jgi:hypothetical protein
MPTRKPTLAELNQMITLSRELIKTECQSHHPTRRFRCQLEAGHACPHQWQRQRGIIHKWSAEKGREMIRQATLDDIQSIKKLADQHRQELERTRE